MTTYQDLDLGAMLGPAMDLDTGWWTDAFCHGWASRNTPGATPWTMAAGDPPREGIKAHKWVDYALIHCGGCPASYDCARYAVLGRMQAGTWSMRIKLLRWLQGQDDALAIIAEAEANHEQVQVHVRAVRQQRET